LVAEIEEEWVIPVDPVMESAGGHVFRRTRSELAESQFGHDIAAFKSEIKELEAEAAAATGAAKAKLQSKMIAAKSSLEGAVQRAQQWSEGLSQEAEAKADALKTQLTRTKNDVKGRVESRAKHVQTVYHARTAKLSKAWVLTKEALT
jgi:cell division septum initiation protein DivIVA